MPCGYGEKLVYRLGVQNPPVLVQIFCLVSMELLNPLNPLSLKGAVGTASIRLLIILLSRAVKLYSLLVFWFKLKKTKPLLN